MISEAQKRAARKWDAAHRQILTANIDRADADRIRQHAAARGESVNAFLRRAALEQIARDNAPTPAPAAEARKRKYQKGMPGDGQLIFSDED